MHFAAWSWPTRSHSSASTHQQHCCSMQAGRHGYLTTTQSPWCFALCLPPMQLSESSGKRVHLLLPDEVEFRRAFDM